MQFFITSKLRSDIRCYLDNYITEICLITLGICFQELRLGDSNSLLHILCHILLLMYLSHTYNYKHI